MSNEKECFREEQDVHCMDRVAEALRDFGRSRVGGHMRGVARESLLLARSVLDACIERLEGESPEPMEKEPKHEEADDPRPSG